MSIIPFLVKRGLSQNLPESLMEGELAVTTDTHKLYVGTGESRVLLNPDSQASETAQRLETARNITLSGKVNGQTSFDGSKNVTIDTDLSEDVKQQLQKLDQLGTAATKNVGTTNGTVPVIGSDNKLDPSILPLLAITETNVVNSQEEMLGLTAQMGDVAIRTDLNKTFILAGEDASSLDSWKEMLTPTDVVLSVNGKTGAVVLAVADIEGAAPKENPTFTGTVIVPKPGADDNSEKAAPTSWIREFITALTGSGQPKELGSASAGSSNKFSREDHVHPLPTVIDGGTF